MGVVQTVRRPATPRMPPLRATTPLGKIDSDVIKIIGFQVRDLCQRFARNGVAKQAQILFSGDDDQCLSGFHGGFLL